ncbi:MAG: SRPBCC domain-containing protein [Rhodoblastus sp.]|nr:SRPBCC domain-containing protein [Rhodoblastus sp.]
MTTQTVIVDQVINASPARVWERISTPEGVARWWGAGDIAPVLGHEFRMDMGKWGMIPCRVIEVVPFEKLAYTFEDFELHWAILPQAEGCVLRLEHRGFDLSNPRHRHAFENMGPGWRDHVLPKLARVSLEAA